MPLVRYFMRPCGKHRDKLMPIIQELSNRGVRVLAKPVPTNISIVLDGKNENPMAFSGRKVLAYWTNFWGIEGFFDELYKPILEEYYDELLDMTNLTIGEAVDRLINYEIKTPD